MFANKETLNNMNLLKIRKTIESINIEHEDDSFECTGYKHKIILILFNKHITIRSKTKAYFNAIPPRRIFRRLHNNT